MKFNLKKAKKNLQKSRKALFTMKGKKPYQYLFVLLIALIIGGAFMLSGGITFNFYGADNQNTTTTTTYWTSPTSTQTTTSPTTTYTHPEGTWFYLKVMIMWNAWVDPTDYRRIEVDISQLDYVNIGSHTFEKTESNSWYQYTTFAVKLDSQVLISMFSLHDPGEYGTSRYSIDYTTISAGYFGGQFEFFDYHAPMSAPNAGWLAYEWVEL
jgi:hypothetical protein